MQKEDAGISTSTSTPARALLTSLVEGRSGDLVSPAKGRRLLLAADSNTGLLAACPDGEEITLWRLQEGAKLVCIRKLRFNSNTTSNSNSSTSTSTVDGKIAHLAIDGPCLVGVTGDLKMLRWRLDDMDTLDSNMLPQFQIAVLGEANVGKDKISDAITEASCAVDEDYGGDMTLGLFQGSSDDTFAYLAGEVMINNVRTRIKVMHNSGDAWSELLQHAVKTYCHLVLLMFDLTERSTLEKLESKWFKLARAANEDIKLIIVGNKSDLRDPSVASHVSTEEASAVAQRLNADYIETSLLYDTWVEESSKIWDACKAAYLSCAKKEIKVTEMQTISLHEALQPPTVTSVAVSGDLLAVSGIEHSDSEQKRGKTFVVRISSSFEQGQIALAHKFETNGAVINCVVDSKEQKLAIIDESEHGASLVTLDNKDTKRFEGKGKSVALGCTSILLASGGDSGFSVWDRKSGSSLLSKEVNVSTVATTEEFVAVVDHDQQLSVWQYQSPDLFVGPQCVTLSAPGHCLFIRENTVVAISPEGEWSTWFLRSDSA